MTAILPLSKKALPDHTQLPDSDGAVVQNFQEHPQSMLLTDAILPVLKRLYPDGQYCIGQDSGIYWRETDPPLRGCLEPDWFCVLDVPPTLAGQVRGSYVMWQELIHPAILLEFASGNGAEERDRTPLEGKFWIYERRIRPDYYGIYEVKPGRIDLYRLSGGLFESVTPNERGHFSIPQLAVELGIWQGTYLEMDLPWMRWYDANGVLLPIGREEVQHYREVAQHYREVAQQERVAAQLERREKERLAELVRRLGGDPNPT
jgi:Uma2 family endonuclease